MCGGGNGLLLRPTSSTKEINYKVGFIRENQFKIFGCSNQHDKLGFINENFSKIALRILLKFFKDCTMNSLDCI